MVQPKWRKSKWISIHAPREGRDQQLTHPSNHGREISIHAPREGRDVIKASLVSPIVISIHAPREGRDDKARLYFWRMDAISIHAPREGRDQALIINPKIAGNFNPRAPRGARLGFPVTPSTASTAFQSTRPARGATAERWAEFIIFLFQSTRPARGATVLTARIKSLERFQSTRPARGATTDQPAAGDVI